ncbi:hypothetical protein FQN57_003114 [Myotisia sp. PD_48]|nr:hypothetical protein FQN57_003114 [Myotisia sp. PD_48]
MPPQRSQNNYGSCSPSTASSPATSTSSSQAPSRQSSSLQVNRSSVVTENTPMVSRDNLPRNYQASSGDAVNPDPNPAATISSHNPPNQSQNEDGSDDHGYDDQASRASSGSPHEMSWYKKVAEKYGSLELENKGSVARDHLALERTFLSWLRTSLAFASIGIAITQLFRLNTAIRQQTPSANSSPPVLSNEYIESSDNIYFSISEGDRRLRSLGKPLGATFIGIAIVVLFIGFHRYFESQYWVVRGKFPASRGSVALIAFITASLMVSSLVVILTIAPSGLER